MIIVTRRQPESWPGLRLRAGDLAVAMLAALPVAIVYLAFQRRVTQAIMLSAGIKG